MTVKVAIKNGMLNPVFEGLGTLMQSDELGMELAFRVRRIIKKLTTQSELFEEQRSELLKKYSVLDENGEPVVNENRITIKDGKEAEFNEVFTVLANQTGDEVPAIKASELVAQKKLKVKPMVLVQLGDLLIDDYDGDVEVDEVEVPGAE